MTIALICLPGSTLFRFRSTFPANHSILIPNRSTFIPKCSTFPAPRSTFQPETSTKRSLSNAPPYSTKKPRQFSITENRRGFNYQIIISCITECPRFSQRTNALQTRFQIKILYYQNGLLQALNVESALILSHLLRFQSNVQSCCQSVA